MHRLSRAATSHEKGARQAGGRTDTRTSEVGAPESVQELEVEVTGTTYLGTSLAGDCNVCDCAVTVPADLPASEGTTFDHSRRLVYASSAMANHFHVGFGRFGAGRVGFLPRGPSFGRPGGPCVCQRHHRRCHYHPFLRPPPHRTFN